MDGAGNATVLVDFASASEESISLQSGCVPFGMREDRRPMVHTPV